MSSEPNINRTTDLEAEEESRGVKRSADKSEINVHTANDWEHARLEGGDERKQKFLRLMGAGKKDHTGKVSIGDHDSTKQHGRSDKEEEELESNLKKQYEANLEYKLTGGARRHKGLGFQDEEKSKEEAVVQEVQEGDSSKNDQEKPDESGDNIGKESSEKHEDASEDKKDASEDKNSTQESKTSDSTKKYSMSFVKASS